MNIKYTNEQNERTTEFIDSVNGSVPFIRFKCFENMDFINHGFSTRLGGTSKGIYSSMNLSFGRGDDNACVEENFRLIASAIGTNPENMVNAMQTHTANVLKVGKDKCGMGVTQKRDFSDIDGLVTNEPGVCLVTSYADCIPLFFVDPVKKCIGLSHSGWRGTVSKIGINTVRMMEDEFGSELADIIAFIGPGICKDCYEISSDVADEFNAAYTKEQSENLLTQKSDEKYHLDLHQANVYNLLNAGLNPEHIHVTDICTCCNPEILFSHRASHGQRGGMCGFLEIKE